MPWEHFWPIVITLLGAGLSVLVAELGYRTIRKLVRWRRRKAQARPASSRLAWLAVLWRQLEQFIEILYRLVQLLAALLGAQLFAASIDSGDFKPIAEGLWDGICLALIWIGAVSLLWVVTLVGGLGAFGSDLGRRFRSQLETFRRVLSVLVFLAIIVIILIQLDHAQALGSTVLAGAGLVGVVAGLAAQRFLANMFAGIAIGFSDKLNIGDVVEFEGESGTVTARTLTYVALKLSEQRTLVVPTSQFLDKAHTDWKLTRKQVVGWVPLQVDWGVSIPDLLAALQEGHRKLGASASASTVAVRSKDHDGYGSDTESERDEGEELDVDDEDTLGTSKGKEKEVEDDDETDNEGKRKQDEEDKDSKQFGTSDLRVEVIGVTESAVQVRAMVRATPDDLWDYQCKIREHLVDWINRHGAARPRLRAEVVQSGGHRTSSDGGSSDGGSSSAHLHRQRRSSSL